MSANVNIDESWKKLLNEEFESSYFTSLKEFLVGDGMSVLYRWGQKGYIIDNKEENDKQKNRLRDAVYRKNIHEIKAVIEIFRDIEEKEGIKRERGLIYLYNDRFCITEAQIKKLKNWTLFTIGVSFFAILFSIVSLGIFDSISDDLTKRFLLWISILLLLISLILVFIVTFLGFSENTRHETDRKV